MTNQPNSTNGHSNGMNGHSNGVDGYGTNGHSNGTNGHSNGTNGYSNGTNGHSNAANGHFNGSNGQLNGSNGLLNGSNGHITSGTNMAAANEAKRNGNIESFHTRDMASRPGSHNPFVPIAICGMACRLPGGVHSPSELWSFLKAGGDARGPVPSSRYNVSAFYSPDKKPGSIITREGYFLDETNDLAALDTTFFSMSRNEVETLDPQQRMLLEVTHEALHDAGEKAWKGSKTGVYVGSYGQDYYDVSVRDTQAHGIYQILGAHDFMVSNRVSHELDLHGPSVTIRTACSGSLIGVNEACLAMARGDCTSAIVGGTNIIMAPAVTAAETQQGVLSPDGSCKVFSTKTNGYARGEGVVAIYLKPLSAAVRDGNPIRAVVTGSATNHNGHTPTVARPSSKAQESLIRQAYRNAGIDDITKTGFFECHGTGTSVGDPTETAAVSACFGDVGVYIGSVKSNLGHAEGAAGLVGILKAVLALENLTIPPQIKSLPRNPAIDKSLMIATEPTPWPKDRDQRVSVSSFGLGGSNAHAIVESAASFGVTREYGTRRAAAKAPQLLLFSANTPASLKATLERYEVFLNRTPDLLADVAYTLANKREHRPHRTFAVCTSEKLTLSGGAPQNKVETNHATSLIMVFTGQGAQWARMGYELLRSKSNTVFSSSIASLDKALQELGPLAPSWSIDEELRKPARKSRVDEAEFSQPLCTALQIALVDHYASIGVHPDAVVGHSSGEVAAAYAARGLTAREAILVAYMRGLAVSKEQSRKGAMGALGLSWDAAKKHLLPGVVLACDNAPNSVTISGDAGPVQETVANIKNSGSGVLATLLKVERAYHSPHMLEIGGEYHANMTAANIVGKVHTVPFYSSVSGEFFAPAAKSRFGPRYWSTNLECPVRFTSAVSDVIQQNDGSRQVFLEIGPHAALAGPLRQIISHNSSSATYISSLTRKTDCAESWLSALGQLHNQDIFFDLERLMPDGNTLSDLPSYPWDHHRSHWSESRIAREWRMRKHPHHDLLGSKIPDTTDLEPVWRNVLHVENAAWIRDHKINGDIIFPFAGYVAMAAEAIRQITDIDEAVELRNVVVPTALVLNGSSTKELVTSFHQLRLTSSLDSEWWEFCIASHNGHTWTKHCSGEVRARDGKNVTRDQPVLYDLPRKASSKRWYDIMRRAGIDYGHHFVCLNDITTETTGARVARAHINNGWHGDEHFYHLHPVVLDSYLQLLSVAASYGLTHDYRQALPASIGSLVLRRSTANDFVVSATAKLAGSGVHGMGIIAANGGPVIEVSDVRLTSFPSEDVEHGAPIAARSEWVPHLESEPLINLLNPVREWQSYDSKLLELFNLSAIASRGSTAGIEVIPELQTYKSWLDETSNRVDDLGDKDDALIARIDSLTSCLEGTASAPIAKAIRLITNNLPDIVSGRKKAFEVLDTEDTLGKFNRTLEEFDGSEFYRRIGHYKPNLRILELGAGVGSATTGIFQALTREDGQTLFSQYVLSDPSPGMVEALKTRFQSHSNVSFETFDIGIAAGLQGFEEKDFDLIIAAGVLHKTPQLSESLDRIRQLLSPSGKLLMQSLSQGLPWSRYVLGCLPEWGIGISDSRVEEPYIDASTWKAKLAGAGLEVYDKPDCDSNGTSHVSYVIIAKPRNTRVPARKITILSESPMESMSSQLVVQELRTQEYDLTYCNLTNIPPPGQDILALLDNETSFLDQLDATRFGQLRAFISNITDSGMLWITQSCQSSCVNPNFGQITGLARCIRSELGVAFATCEVDDLKSVQGCRAITGVMQRFLDRTNDGGIDPDFEYVVENGLMRVNRFFPVPDTATVASSETVDDARLTISHPGRLDTLYWGNVTMDTLQEDEVEVEIHAAGLNFRDVLVATGIIELLPPTFGYEATGVVRRVGPTTTKLSVGDRVALTGVAVFASTVTMTEKLCERLPDELDFVKGASMPLVFATAIYSLINVGGLEHNQAVLIHSGCGGVGLAAIQLALMIGARIYTTVSSKQKIDFLVREYGIPRNHIFNSHDASFEKDLMRETKGRGVDLALNSLSGELLHATWRCVAKWGTLVEIGKRDLLGGGKLNMELFLANRSYRCVDIDQMCRERPVMIGQLLQSMMQFYRDGHIRAITIDETFPGFKVQEAFQHMQQGRHIGKIVLQIRDAETGQLQLGPIQPASSNRPTMLDSTGSYLLIGGLGGLGRSVAVWMVQHGARNLTFLSRSAGTTDQDRFFTEELQSMGCNVRLVRGSVTNAADVTRAVAESPCPIKGILQMTMVLHDQAWNKMTLDEWNGAIAPKVQGTWNLHNSTLEQNLDFFILFSSLSGIVGQPGQANYASANTFLDAFVKFRTDKGLPCTSLNIGAVEGAGYLVDNDVLLKKMKGTGWRAVQESELLDMLGSVMRPSPTVSAQEPNEKGCGPKSNLVSLNNTLVGIAPVIPLSSPDSSAQLRKDVRMSVFRNIRSHAKSGASNDLLRQFLTTVKANSEALSKAESITFLSQEIGRKLLGLVLRPVDGEVDISLSLAQLGLDSMVAVEMRAWWKQMFGMDISVMEMLSMSTLEGLGKHAASGLLAMHS